MTLNKPSLSSKPDLTTFEKSINKLVPGFLKIEWNLEALLACALENFEPGSAREDIEIKWINTLQDISEEMDNFFRDILGYPIWIVWRHRIKMNRWRIAVGFWDRKPASYMIIQQGRKDKMRYGEVMHKNSAFVGPAYTAPFARGKKIYPYLLSEAFVETKKSGYDWAYGAVSFENESSIKGIDKFGFFRFAGSFLLHKYFFRYRIIKAEVSYPEAVDLSNTQTNRIVVKSTES